MSGLSFDWHKVDSELTVEDLRSAKEGGVEIYYTDNGQPHRAVVQDVRVYPNDIQTFEGTDACSSRRIRLRYNQESWEVQLLWVTGFPMGRPSRSEPPINPPLSGGELDEDEDEVLPLYPEEMPDGYLLSRTERFCAWLARPFQEDKAPSIGAEVLALCLLLTFVTRRPGLLVLTGVIGCFVLVIMGLTRGSVPTDHQIFLKRVPLRGLWLMSPWFGAMIIAGMIMG